MKIACFAAALALLLSTPATHAAEPAALAVHVEGLVRVEPKRLDSAWLLPGADFRDYRRVILEPGDVAFRRNFLRDVNRGRTLSTRVSDDDAAKLLADTQASFREVFDESFRASSYELASAPAEDVLIVRPSIVNLYVTAPDTDRGGGRARTYTVEAGEATLVLTVHDSLSGALLGVAVDERTAGSGGVRADWTTSTSNRSNFAAMFRRWAKNSIDGLDALKEHSPVAPSTPR